MIAELLTGLGLGGASAGLDMLGSAYQFGLNRKMAKYNQHLGFETMDKQYAMNQQSLKDTPSAYMAGLKNAGLNPMLVVSNGVPSAPTVSPSYGNGSGVSAPDLGSAVQVGMNAAKLSPEVRSANAQADMDVADASSAKAEANARKAEAKLDKEYADMEYEALKDDDYKVEVDGKDTNPTRSEYRQMIRNDIQRRRYTNSREHAIGEDTINAIHGGTSAFQEFSRGYNSWSWRRRDRR